MYAGYVGYHTNKIVQKLEATVLTFEDLNDVQKIVDATSKETNALAEFILGRKCSGDDDTEFFALKNQSLRRSLQLFFHNGDAFQLYINYMKRH
jgi:hypothetical protein